jgi:hypothetical protein
VACSVVDLAALAVQDEQLGQALSAIAELRDRLDELEDVQVENARRLGWSWSEIARPLGISRQAVHHKHATRVLDGDPGRRDRMTMGDVRRCLARARREAAALGHDSVGSDHLLLGLLADESAARPLRELGVAPADVREAVVQRRRTTRRRSRLETTTSSRAEANPDGWLREAFPFREEGLTAGDALLALLRDNTGAASQVLARLGVSAAAIEERVARAR